MTNDQTPHEPLEHELVAEARSMDAADETITVEGTTLRGLSDAMSRVGDKLVEEILPWEAGGRDVVIGTVGKIPVLVMDTVSGAVSSITGVRHVLIEGKRFVVFGTVPAA